MTAVLLSKRSSAPLLEREFFIGNLLVRIHFIIVMIRWTGLAPWQFEFPFSGSLTSTFLAPLLDGDGQAHGTHNPRARTNKDLHQQSPLGFKVGNKGSGFVGVKES